MSDSRAPPAGDPAPPGAGPRAGEIVGGYRLGRLIAQGLAGPVYEADGPEGQRVAMKVLAAEDGHVVAATRAAAAIEHLGLVAILDAGRVGDSCFVAMQLAKPRSAASFLRSSGRLHWAEATAVAADCCAALEAAHADGVIHGDIRPEKILCSAIGATCLGGLGRAPDGANTSPHASPERRRGAPPDVPSDVFALGATYFALLTGKAPSGPHPDPRQEAPGVPPACARVILRALDADPARRYASMKAMGADLAAALREAPEVKPQFLVAGDPSAQAPDLDTAPLPVVAVKNQFDATLTSRNDQPLPIGGARRSDPSVQMAEPGAPSNAPPARAPQTRVASLDGTLRSEGAKRAPRGRSPWLYAGAGLLAVALIAILVIALGKVP